MEEVKVFLDHQSFREEKYEVEALSLSWSLGAFSSFQNINAIWELGPQTKHTFLGPVERF